MSELIVNGYKRLFEVRLLHHYWLDEGATTFDDLTESKRNKLLLAYDSRPFIDVNPTATTAADLKAFRAVFKNTSLGFVVAVPKTTVIPDSSVFSFIITITDPAFYHYTALTFVKHNIYELYHAPVDKILRFKENVPVFSNLTGVSRTLNAVKALFLSAEIPASAPTDKVEYFNIAGGSLVQLTSDQPGAASLIIDATATDKPVYVNQNDTPLLVPPAGLAGAPPKGIQLSSEIPDQVFGLIHISAVKPGDSDYSCTTAQKAKENCPVFQIRFKNRSAFWKYFAKNSGTFISETAAALPLTYKGNAGVKKKPGESGIKVKYQNDDPTQKIEKIFTEIFE